MSNNLLGALEFAKRGWKLFPAVFDGGRHTPLVKWSTESSSDLDMIRHWADIYRGCYFCVDINSSGITVIDIDRKNGKDGFSLLRDFEGVATLKATTPSGGEHWYFEGLSACTVGSDTKGIGAGVDTPPMVPLAGQVCAGKGVYGLLKDSAVSKLPEILREKIGVYVPRTAKADPFDDWDVDVDIGRAIEYLKHAEPSLQGEGGDMHAYSVACRLRDMGISQSTAESLMLEHWYPRCDPNDKPEFIERKVRNAFEYAKSSAGVKSVTGLFGESIIKPQGCSFAKRGSEVAWTKRKPRDWLLGRRFLPGYITLTIAPPGTGKSTFAIAEALSIATGRQLTHDRVYKRGAVWVYSTEDPMEELENTLVATGKTNNISKSVLDNLWLSSGCESPIKLAAHGPGGQRVANEQLIKQIVEFIKDNGIRLFVLDPLVRCHSLKESDNDDMDFLFQIFSHIAQQAGCAINLVHHTPKGKTTPGDRDAARGAGALVAAARIAHTIYTMTEKEAKAHFIPVERAPWYMRVDIANSNLSSPGAKVQWYEKKGVQIFEGSQQGTGVVVPAYISTVESQSIEGVILSLAPMVLEAGVPVPVAKAVEVFEAHPLVTLKERALRDKLVAMAEDDAFPTVKIGKGIGAKKRRVDFISFEG